MIGIDWGGNCGLVRLSDDGEVACITTVVRAPKCDALPARALRPARTAVTTNTRWGQFSRELRIVLDQWVQEAHCDVALEDPGHCRTADQAGSYWRCRAVAEEVCARRGTALINCPTGRVKRTATGNGRAEKEAMIAAAIRRWPLVAREEWTEHIADAAWIAECARRGEES